MVEDVPVSCLQLNLSHRDIATWVSNVANALCITDRKYYLEKDPAHLEFVARLKDIIQNVRVVDYEPGKF